MVWRNGRQISCSKSVFIWFHRLNTLYHSPKLFWHSRYSKLQINEIWQPISSCQTEYQRKIPTTTIELSSDTKFNTYTKANLKQGDFSNGDTQKINGYLVLGYKQKKCENTRGHYFYCIGLNCIPWAALDSFVYSGSAIYQDGIFS